jgi:hypothetical protein
LAKIRHIKFIDLIIYLNSKVEVIAVVYQRLSGTPSLHIDFKDKNSVLHRRRFEREFSSRLSEKRWDTNEVIRFF